MGRWLAGCFVMFVAAGCGGGGGGGDGGGDGQPLPDLSATAQTISFVAPGRDAVGVATNTRVLAAFSEEKDPATITPETLFIAGVAASVHYDQASKTAEISPQQPLAPNTQYTATVSRAVTDWGGRPLSADYTWSFRTGDAEDVRSPAIIAVDVAGDTSAAALNGAVSVTFSEPMTPSTVNADTVSLTGPEGEAVAGTVVYDGWTATYTPSQDLEPSTTYTVTVAQGAEDLAGNPVAGQVSATVTTGETGDDSAPWVADSDPAPDAVDVPINRALAIHFSEAIAAGSITSESVALTQGGLFVSGTVACMGSTVLFSPSAPLARNTVYRVTVAATVRDLAGNLLAAAESWNFVTGDAGDEGPAEVEATVPTDGATDVPVDTPITWTLNETVNPFASGTVDGVPALVRYDFASRTFVLVPSSNLLANTTYLGTVRVSDLAGNPTTFSLRFTTGPEN